MKLLYVIISSETWVLSKDYSTTVETYYDIVNFKHSSFVLTIEFMGGSMRDRHKKEKITTYILDFDRKLV